MATTDYANSNLSMPTWTSGEVLSKDNLDKLNTSITSTYNTMQNQIGNPSLRNDGDNSIYQDIDDLKAEYEDVNGRLTPFISNFDSNVQTSASNFIQGTDGATTIYNGIKTLLDADYQTTKEAAVNESIIYTDKQDTLTLDSAKSYTDEKIIPISTSVESLTTTVSSHTNSIDANATDISTLQTNLGTTNTTLSEVKKEVEEARTNVDTYDITKDQQLVTTTYASLADTIAAVSYSAYQNIVNYVPYSIVKLDSEEDLEGLLAGEERTFYLVPNKSNTGFEKWWYITYDDNGEEKQKWDKFGGSTTLIVSELPSFEEADPEADYILKVDDAYTYYKYIDDEWRMIAGSMVKVESDKIILVVDELPESQVEGAYYLYKDDEVWKIKKDSDDAEDFTCSNLTDYYFKNTKGVYLHYRYIDDNFELVGADTSELEAKVNTKLDKNFSAGNAGKGLIVATNGEVIASDIVDNTAFHGLYTDDNGVNYLLYDSDNTESKVEIPDNSSSKISEMEKALNDVETAYFKSVTVSQDTSSGVSTITFYGSNEDTSVASIQVAGGSGSGGTGIATSVTIENNTVINDNKVMSYSVSSTDDANISFIFRDSADAEKDPQTGTVNIYINGTLNSTFTLNQNETYTFNAKGLLKDNYSNKIKVTIEDDNGAFAGKTWTISTVAISVSAVLNEETIYYVNNSISIQYTPIGSGISKVVHFLVDGEEVATSNSITTSNSQYHQNITIGTHGAHSVDIYATTVTSTATISSDIVHFGIIVVDTTSTIPIISFHDDAPSGQIYTTANLAFFVYNPLAEYASVVQDIDGVTTNLTVGRSTQYLSLYPTSIKSYNITLSTKYDDNGTTKTLSKTIVFTATALSYDIHQVTDGLIFDFNPSGRSNNEDRESNSSWSWDGSKVENTEIPMTISDNFDWINGGFQTDSDGNTAFVVKSGTRATINYKAFAQGNSISQSGMNMKFIFKVMNSRKFGAKVLSNVETKTDSSLGCGFYVESNDATLRTSANTSIHQYICEEEYTELEYNITPPTATGHSEMFINLQGVPSRFAKYTSASDFEQSTNPENITIGSDDCDVWVYRVKLYGNSLSDSDIINSFIADAPNANTMIERYLRNQITNDNDDIGYEELAETIPEMRVILIDCPRFTMDKDDKVKGCTIRQIMTGGRDEDNWTATDVTIKGQGTSSNKYGDSARNIDIDIGGGFTYETDINITDDDGNILYLNGSTKATKTTTVEGVDTTEELKDDDGNQLYTDGTIVATKRGNVTKSKYSMTANSIAEKYFNIKVNVASSENMNNAVLAELYNEYQPYIREARSSNSKVRDTMEFHPCAIFVKPQTMNADYPEPYVEGTDDYYFYAIGDFGNSKKNTTTQGLDYKTRPYECIVELANNTDPLNLYKSYDTEGKWEDELDTDDEAPLSFRYSAPDKKYGEDFYQKNEDESYTALPTMTVGEETVPYIQGDTEDDKVQVAVDNVTYFTGESVVKLEEKKLKEAWTNVLKWVNSTDTTEGVTNAELETSVTYPKPTAYTGTDGNTYYTFDSSNPVTYTNDTVEYRLAKFAAEFDNYFVSDSLMYHYCFITHFEMVDNRAKNTFAHCHDVTVANPKWDFVFDYDNDTAMGINNEGVLALDYGVEDGDLNDAGVPYYNGQDSVLWNNVKMCFQDRISTMYNSKTDLWAINSFISKCDEYQSLRPERLWLEDARRKYIRPYEDLGATLYIDMLNGTKELQRKYFIKYQVPYMASRYTTSIAKNDAVTFRTNLCADGTGTTLNLSVTPYSDLYVTVVFGSSTYKKRCKSGETFTVSDPDKTMSFNDTESSIYSASMIEQIDGFSTVYSNQIDFSKAIKLKKLIIGSDSEGYSNTNLKITTGEIPLAALTNLEELQIDNCSALNAVVDVSGCTSLSKFSCKNTPITNVIFSNGGALNEVYMYSPITLTLRNLTNIETFVVQNDYATLERLYLENISYPDAKEIIQKATNLTNIRLVGVDWTGDNSITNAFYPYLDDIYEMYGLDENGNTQTKSVITGSGELYIGTSWHQRDIDNYKEQWPNFELSTEGDEAYRVEQYLVQFYDDDRTTLLWQGYADNGSYVYDNTGEYSEDGKGTYKGVGDPVALGYISTPTKAASAQYTYTYKGWSSEFNSMVNGAAISVYAEYSTEDRYYTVGWYRSLNTPFTYTAEDGTIESSIIENVKYGTAVEFDEDKFGIPTTPYAGSQYSVFAGWDRSTGYITGNTTVYAIWQSSSVPTIPTDKDSVDYLSTYTDAQIFAIASTTRYTASQFFTSGDERVITLGNDYNFTGLDANGNALTTNKGTNGKVEQKEIVSVDDPVTFDGTNYIDTGIKLFDADMPSFTLVVDYKILTSQANNTILSCYDDYSSSTIQGLLLKGNASSSPTLSWGEKSQQIGSNGYRDIISMRHIKGDKSLYIYYSNTSSSLFSDSVNQWQLNPESSENYSSSLQLVLGAKKRGETYVENGKVKVYWCKVWYDDLGEYATKKLVSWYREKITVKYVANQNYYLENDVGNTSKASFVSNNLLAYRTHYMNSSTSASAREWGSTTMKTFLNGRLLESFPLQWRAMIKSVNTITYNGTDSTSTSSTYSKIYLPTYSNVNSTTDNTEGSLYDIITSNVSKIRIKGYSLPEDYNSYTDTEDPSNQTRYNIKEGDLWALNGEVYNGYCVYLPKTTGTELNLTLAVEAANDSNYGWYKTNYWYTRTPYNNGYTSDTGFWAVSDYGYLTQYQAMSTVPGICPCFSI